MALTEQQVRDINIALGDSFDEQQKKAVIIVINSTLGAIQSLEAGAGLEIFGSTISLQLASGSSQGGLFKLTGTADDYFVTNPVASDLATAITLVNGIRAKFNALVSAMASTGYVTPGI